MPLLVAACMTAGACSLAPEVADCDAPRVPAAAVPEVDGFRIVGSAQVEPEGCGDAWERTAVLTADATDDASALESFAAALEARGWTSTACVTDRERCFDSPDGYFLAATTPAGAAGGGAPQGYPQPTGSGPQVLVSVSRSPAEAER